MENEKKGAAPTKQNDKKVLIVKPGAVLKKTKKVLSFEDKLLKVKKMTDLVYKREKLNDAILKLDSVCDSDAELETKLTLSDGKNYNSTEFNTTNTVIIEDVAEFLKDKIFKSIENVEAEIEALV